jgi:hypothetical protein
MAVKRQACGRYRFDMCPAVKTGPILWALALSVWLVSQSHAAPSNGQELRSPTERYSQKNLLKNWALAVCLAEIAHDVRDRADASAAASAYLEFGKQPLEAYDALRNLAKKFARLDYQGSIDSEFNTMKCIDLFHSSELDKLAASLSRKR